jgi:cytochrome c551/c552
VGPAYKDVAAKRTEKQIIQSIINGSKGKWVKNAAMPSFRYLSEDDIKLLAKWVKAQK